MRRIIITIGLLSMIFICSCGQQEKKDTINGNTKENSVISGTDKTVATINETKMENAEILDDVVYSECDYAQVGTIVNESKYATDIISGSIQKVTYDAIDGLAWTKADVLVDEVCKGDLVSGDTISVYIQGGYISLTEMLKFSQDSFRYTDEQLANSDNICIKQVFDGEDFAVKGDSNVFYLCRTNSEKFPSGSYERVLGKYGEMEIDTEKKIIHYDPINVDEEDTENFTMKEIRKYAEKYGDYEVEE